MTVQATFKRWEKRLERCVAWCGLHPRLASVYVLAGSRSNEKPRAIGLNRLVFSCEPDTYAAIAGREAIIY